MLCPTSKFGGAPASEVYEYLQSLGDADPKYVDLPVPSGYEYNFKVMWYHPDLEAQARKALAGAALTA